MSAFLRVSVLSLAVASSALAASGRPSERRQVGEFDSIDVHAGIHLTVAIGERSVEVTTDDETMPKVVTEVKDGVLEVGFEHKVFGLWSGVHNANVEVRVRTPRLRSVQASGGADAVVGGTTEAEVHLGASGGGSVTAEHVAAREVALSASGGATVTAGGLDAKELRASGSGGATFKLAGKVTDAKFKFSGGTEVKAADLSVQHLAVHGSGGGSAKVQVADSIEGSLSGGSTVHVGGSPRADVRTSGGGEVVYADGRRSRDERKSWRSHLRHRDSDRQGDEHDEDDED